MLTVYDVLGVVRTIGLGRLALTSANAPTVAMVQQQPVRVIFARPKEAGAVVIGGLKRVLLSGACHLHLDVTRIEDAPVCYSKLIAQVADVVKYVALKLATKSQFPVEPL